MIGTSTHYSDVGNAFKKICLRCYGRDTRRHPFRSFSAGGSCESLRIGTFVLPSPAHRALSPALLSFLGVQYEYSYEYEEGVTVGGAVQVLYECILNHKCKTRRTVRF